MSIGGQVGWLVEGTGGNRITQTLNQKVSLGHEAPTSDSEQSTSVWKPLNLESIAPNSLVELSVELAVIDSMGTIGRDQFRWSMYNTNNQHLFSLVFDNSTLSITHISTDGAIHDTGTNFANGVTFNLIILMDFTANRWNAWLSGNDLRINSPIRVGPGNVSLGHVRAVWFYSDPTSPGDNYMLFDNYRVTLETILPTSLQPISAINGQFRLRLFGEIGAKYALEGSSTLLNNSWVVVKTTSVLLSNSFDFTDPMPPAPSRRLYRARWVP